MPALPDDPRTLPTSELLDAYDCAPTAALRAEVLRRLRLVPMPDTPETVAEKARAARKLARLFDTDAQQEPRA